ncbi:hypothetical protein CH376_23765 [Leptospira adleri]|uniref:Uncharacterized protein n=1 Tax=Leptospira adleri TaxID=2023186 RepID=A0ABX4NUI8_9LEPT|nr:hypothetical protein CH376_23765 [Leptospira adleri]
MIFSEVDNLKMELLRFLESCAGGNERYNELISPIINRNFINALGGWLSQIKGYLDRIEQLVSQGDSVLKVSHK